MINILSSEYQSSPIRCQPHRRQTRFFEDFQRRFPSGIRQILHDQNAFSQGEYPSHESTDCIKGEFVALCEGDDYWVSDDKIVPVRGLKSVSQLHPKLD